MSEINQSLDRGMQILELIDLSADPLGVREISRQLGFGSTIVHRLVSTLTGRGFVEQVSDTRKYKIGHRSISLGISNRRSDTLVAAVNGRLSYLAQEYMLNGFLGMLKGRKAIYMLSVPSRGRIVLKLNVGEMISLHTTALGKVLLASVGDEKAMDLLGSSKLEQLTPKSITNISRIISQLPDVRRLGYASVNGENTRGIISIGAPIRSVSGQVIAGLSVGYPIDTLDLSFQEIVEITMNVANDVSIELGCPDSLMNEWNGT